MFFYRMDKKKKRKKFKNVHPETPARTLLELFLCLRQPGALFVKTAPGPHKNF
jgi:hypothetical protein